MKKFISGTAIGIVGLMGASAAFAQEAARTSTSTPSPAVGSTGLEEIVVTAQKRSESAQDVPITLNVVSADRMRETGIVSLQQLEVMAPGTQLTSYSPIRPDFFIRGIGSSQVTTSVDPSVGVFVDEVFVPRIGAFQMGLRDAERIEVLKGPQGTLFGRNTSAGAISIITPTPSDEFKGLLEARAGSFGGIGGSGSVSGPLSENLLGRVFVDYVKDHGYSTNLTNGHHANGENTLYIASKLLYRINEAKLTFSVDYSRSRLPGEFDKSAGDSPLQSLQNPFLPSYTPYPSINKDFLNFDPFANRRVWRGYVRADIPLGFADVVSLTSYYDTKIAEQLDSDGTPLNIWSFDISETSRVWSQEFRLVSHDESPLSFGGKGKWVVGVYLYDDKSDRTDRVHTFEDSVFAAFGAPFTSSAFNIKIHTKSFAAFGQYDLEIVPGLTLSAGARYTRDNKSADIDAGSNSPGLSIIPNNYQLQNVGDTWDSLDPKFTLSYKPARDVMLYGTYSKGFKSGAFQTLSPLPQFAQIVAKPEGVTNIEAGIKSRWLEGRLQVNGAVYRARYKDLQLQRVTSVVVPGFASPVIAVVTDNAARSEVKGAEIDTAFQIAPVLTVSGGFSYMDGKYKDYIFGPGVDFSGNPIRQAPKYTYSMAVDAYHDFGSLRLTGHVDYFHKSKVYFDVAGNNSPPGLIQDGYGVLSARIALSSPDDGWEVAATGRNLTDKDYFNMAYGIGDGGSAFQTPAAPRNFEVSVRKTF